NCSSASAGAEVRFRTSNWPMLLGGIDIGGTKIAVAVADEQGRLLAQARLPTADAAGPRFAVTRAIDALRTLVPRGERIGALGIGACGPLDSTRGLVLSPPNLPGWDAVPVVRWLEVAFGCPVRLENDCNAAALGEHRFGAGRGVDELLYVTVSTGIGAGILSNGSLVRGMRDGAGEIGHATVEPRGPACVCGNDGCLEVLASGTALARRAREAIAAGRGSMLAGAAEVTAERVIEAVRSGDALACELWDATVEWLAIGIGNAIGTLAPQRVVIGGGVSLAGEGLLFAPLRERLKKRVRLLPVELVEVVPAAFPTEAVLIGALAVAATLKRG
ncbi:MAG: ROK family protein, partial [Myxococcales bacterium]